MLWPSGETLTRPAGRAKLKIRPTESGMYTKWPSWVTWKARYKSKPKAYSLS